MQTTALRRRYGRSKVRRKHNPECQCARTCDQARSIDRSKVKRAKVRPLRSNELYEGVTGAEIGDARLFLVDGEYVRKALDIDFTMGSHDAHSKFIPKGEVWIEQILSPTDRVPLIAHELVERNLMVGPKKMRYEPAHDIASDVERKLRGARP
jgi:hypothetical protein